MKTHLYLGISGDLPVFHTYTTTPGFYAGKKTVGPIGLIEWLELQFGLSGIFPSETERVLALKEQLSELMPEDFTFKKSFVNDPIGVCRRLLNLWDTWRMSGWDGKHADDLPERMKQIAVIENVFKEAGISVVERIMEVTNALGSGNLPNLTIHLIDPVASFPYLYQQLLDLLSKRAMMVEEIFTPQATLGTDLYQLQQGICGNNLSPFQNDHSLQVIYFPNDIHAANAMYSIQKASAWNPVLVGEDNSLLNGLHLSHNTPICNWHSAAGNGQVSQLFFLATAMFKRPVESSQVLAFLASPLSPFSKSLARRLMHVFAERPGFDNEDWKVAIAKYIHEIAGKPNERKKKNVIQFWLQNNRCFEENTYDISLLNEVYEKLQTWATQSAQLEYYTLYKEQLHNLSELCSLLVKVLRDEKDTDISTAKFERLQSQLFTDVAIGLAEAQVGCADAVSVPGAVWSKSKEILMMNAMRYEPSGYLTRYWYQQEKDYFTLKGLPLLDQSHANALYNDGVKKMVLNCIDRLIIVVPSAINGSPVAQPFFLEQWEKILSLKPVTIHAQVLLENIPWEKNTSITSSYPTIPLPKPVTYLNINPTDFKRKKESYSSLEKLFQHPAQWYMEYKLQLRYKPGVALPATSQLRGTLADVVVQQLFTEENRTKDWWNDDDKFRQQVQQVATYVLSCEGLPFLETSYNRSLEEFKNTLSNSLCALRNIIEVNHLNLVGTQQVITSTIGNTPFEGFADLVLKKNEQVYVIDLKWAGYSKGYKERLKNGTDLQLALYQNMTPHAVASGYFMLNDGKLYMREQNKGHALLQLSEVKADDGVSAKNTYEEAVNSLAYRRAEMEKGRLEVGYCSEVDGLDYYNETEAQNLFPLAEEKKYKKTPYDNDLNLFFGHIN